VGANVDRGELIARITQSSKWEDRDTVAGLALSSFEKLPTDDGKHHSLVSNYMAYRCVCDFCSSHCHLGHENLLAHVLVAPLRLAPETEEWIDVSWYSPNFLIDCISMIACTAEGFTDMLCKSTLLTGQSTHTLVNQRCLDPTI
jgi:hypothetical protein